MPKEKLITNIYELAETAPVTGALPAFYQEAFTLPEDLKGLSILDICSGMSAFSEAVFRLGGKPVAIDFNYADFGTLKENFDSTFLAVLEQDTGS